MSHRAVFMFRKILRFAQNDTKHYVILRANLGLCPRARRIFFKRRHSQGETVRKLVIAAPEPQSVT